MYFLSNNCPNIYFHLWNQFHENKLLKVSKNFFYKTQSHSDYFLFIHLLIRTHTQMQKDDFLTSTITKAVKMLC